MKLKNLFLSALCVISLGMLSSCTEKAPEAPVYSDKPFDTISLEADGETVEGVVSGTAVSFSFTTAENFTAARLILTVNDGWKLVFPADPDNYDVSTDPNIYFTDPEGKKVQYTVTITSNALPIVDGSKITVEGGYALTYNVATKAFVITYADGMDRSKVTLVFGEGSLMEGAQVSNPTLDLSEGPAELTITVGTVSKTFPVSIDYSSVLVDPKTWGFSEITTDEQKAKIPSLTVLNATALSKKVPDFNKGGDQPRFYTDLSSRDAQVGCMGILGDYDDTKAMVDMAACNFTIVTFNERDYKGKIVSDATAVKSGKAAESVNSLITMSGCPAAWTCWVKSEGTICSKESIGWWTGVKKKRTSHCLCFGFDDNGKMGIKRITPDPDAAIFHVLGDFRRASDYGFNYASDVLTDATFVPFRDDFTVAGDDWTVPNCAMFYPALVVDGYKVHFVDAMANNPDTETLGNGFNGARSRCYIGRTIDNKLGLAAIDGKYMNIMQGAYVLADLGWTDVYYVGGDDYQADTFLPTITVDGAIVAGQEGQKAKYVIAFDAKK